MNSAIVPAGVDGGQGAAGAAAHEHAVDTGTISWLLPEIVNAFDAATTALRAFRAGAAGVHKRDVDLAPLRVARSQLHQAHGALELGEIAGVTRLTEAIEDLLGLFEDAPERCDAIALDAIIGGCRAIVEYLEDLQAGAPQQPLLLFPSYRDLLTARGAERIHPADLFVVDLGLRLPKSAEGAGLDDEGLRVQRSTFEQALLRYIRNEGDPKALNALSRSVAAIEASVAAKEKQGQSRNRAFWWATRALFEALANGGFDETRALHARIKRVAGRINLQIRKLADGSSAVTERLYTDTLFFVALAAPVTPLVREVQARYRLKGAVPPDYETQRFGRIDPVALRTARDALAAAKVAWSAIVSGDVEQVRAFLKEIGTLVEAVGPIKRRGLAQVAQVIDGIATDLGFEPRVPSAAVGLDVATALLFLEGALERARLLDDAFDQRAAMVAARVEASALGQDGPAAPVDWLDRMSRQAEERLTLTTFAAELQANLRSAEKVLDGFFRDPSDRSVLKDSQKPLAQVSGALALLGHDDAHRAIDHARTAIAGFEDDPRSGDAAAFERLAQSLGAVGFYVEQIKRDKVDATAFRFDAATGRFSAEMAPQPVLASDDHTDSHVEDWAASTALEAPVPEPAAPAVVDTIDAAPLEMAPIEAKTVEAAESPEEAFAATQVPEQDVTLEAEIASRASDAQDRAAQLREHPDNAEAREQLLAAVEDVRRNAMLIDDRELQQEAAALTASLSNDKHEPLGFASAAELSDRVAELVIRANRAAGLAPASIAPMEPVTPVPSEDNVEAIDAELLEIFLEEAATVLSDAEASMRVLDADPESATATANLRRGFHTLKGSGRMVGLMALGDAAWSIEDTLNGHIADQKPASSDLRALIDYAIRYLADWVEELRVSGRSTRIPDALIESARAVRQKGEVSFPKLAVVPSVEPQAAPIAVEPPEDDFIKTTLVQREPAPQDHNYVATTEVLDIGSELPELEFFGLQPELPATALPTGDASEPIEATSVLHEAEPADNFFELSEVIEATMPVEEGAPEPLGEHDDGIALDFELDEPVDIAAAKPEVEEASEPTGTVVPFPMPRPPVRTDETRQIGSMTLSLPLFNIYLTEAEDLLRILTQDFAEWRHELDRYVSESAMRAAHSLAGSSATVGLIPAHDLAAAVEDVLQTLWREPLILTEAQVEHLQEAVQSLRRMLHRFAAERMPEPDVVTIARLLALRREISGELAAPEVNEPDPVEKPALPFEALDFGEPGAESIEATVPDVVEEHRPHVTDEAPTDDPHGFDAITTVGMSETPFDVAAPVEPVATSDEDSTIERSASIAEEPAAERVHVEPATEPAPWYMAVAEEPVEPAPAAIAPTEAEPGIAEQSFLSEVEQEIVEARRAPAVDVAKTVQDEIDPDLLDVFVAEGDEILPQIGELLRTWQARPADPAPARMLLRHLHTLKGSARMAGAMRLGEVVHDMEARVESAARLHEVPATLLDELLSAHDRSLELFDRLQNPGEPEPAPVEAQTVASVDAPDASAEEATRTPIEETDAVAPRQREAVKQTAQQPAVRVNAETLDRLVNLAGEISISRARIDNEVLQVKGAMSDLNENVERLRTQLREIELQAEFQMQSQMQSQQATGHEREKFDPLEFDRFTRFQELTRMMAESVNDVKTVQQNLQKSLDAAETDLASQRRMTRDLQQDLMSVRMVPFSSIAERLYRVARRASKEVDKRVNLDIRGGSVELDRSVLERMAGPFEHLLRNHIAHGIESREKRRASGKDETGELLVEVRQEGNEVVLTFSDDGAGLDYDRIRAKGRELGMIDDRGIGDAEAAELIFHPGFSTASNVTELAGRGVGLDVVRSEALVLAGRVGVDSERGKGTRFTINLPLTLAITQVVLVSVAGRVYALPSVLVEQVQQLRPQPLADAYRAGHLPWAGEQVPVAFLGALLGIEDSVPVAQRASPVLILRSAGERIAVHVDDVVGNQEVVVKNLGPQLARMTGIAGATVLGSGQIVLILNPVQLAQMSRAVEAQNATAIAPAADGVVAATGTDLKTMSTVMVVDDSLTVRRVTQRLLSREGYQVVLAKDGVDALERLQDFPPDVMLVDIEMPRMDGFDLTRNVRNDDRYRHIPIIMITSRTAEKHREHAAQLGVDAYLGKPYQEDELLGLLTVHVGTKRGHPA